MTSIAGVERLFEAHLIAADPNAMAFYRDRESHRNNSIACGYF